MRVYSEYKDEQDQMLRPLGSSMEDLFDTIPEK